MSELEALKSLGAFPVVQAAVAIIVLLAGGWMMLRGSQDKKPPSTNGIPSWALYGPVHDTMSAVHNIAEQGRGTNAILERILTAVASIEKEQREQTLLLESIRNNQEMRGDITIPPPPRRKSSI